MPQRFLKPGLPSSEKWDGCTWPAQSFYVRLITLVDDFGRYEANMVLLKNNAFPLREDLRTGQVLELCMELHSRQLAFFYKVDEKSYLQLTNWTERPRAETSRYPSPKCKGAESLFLSLDACYHSNFGTNEGVDNKCCHADNKCSLPTSKSSSPSSSSSSSSKTLNVEGAKRETVNALTLERRAFENHLMTELTALLGPDEMAKSGGNWRENWVRKHPKLLDSAIGELRYQVKTGATIENRGAWLMDYLKRAKEKA